MTVLAHPSKAKLHAEAAQLRTPEDVKREMDLHISHALAPNKLEILFRPTISPAEYETAKAENLQFAPSIHKTLEKALAPTVGISFEGVDQNTAGGLLPPDIHGSVGATQFVELTNSHLDVYQKNSPNTSVMSVTLAAFFGYSAQTLFDPRVIYDPTWNRWVVTAEAFAESPTVQRHFFAISTSADATGSFYIYNINVNFFGTNDYFWDFPQLGMDRDSIIITANIFPAFTASMFAVAKALLYNGLGFSVPVFTGLIPTLSPPIVLDQNHQTFLISAPGGSVLKLYTLTNSSSPTSIGLSAPIDVPVTPYSVPPQAPQPGTTAKLDTSDGRFANAGTQNNNSLWQVHTINLGGFAAPRFYEIDTTTNTVIQSGFFYASGSSHDFNASIAVNGNNDAFVTYTSIDPSTGINAQIRASGRLHTEPVGVIGSGVVLFNSSTFYTGGGDRGRWGDYSSVTIDPSDPSTAWVINEKINGQTTWGSGIGTITL